jgi:hypothetical protein
MASSNPLSHRDLLERARQNVKQAAQASAPKGDAVTDVTDPTAKGTCTPPEHPSQAKTESSMPGQTTGAPNTTPAPTLETKELKADGTLHADTPAVSSGDNQDKAVTSPTAKLATSVTAVAKQLAALAKSASDKGPEDNAKVEVSEKKEDKAKLPEGLPAKAEIPPFADKADKAEKTEKAAGAEEFELPTDAYVKLAHTILSVEGGMEYAHRLIKQAKGAETADALLNNAINAQAEFEKAAAAHAQGAGLVDQIFAGCKTQAEAEQVVKIASAHKEQISVIEKQAADAESAELEKLAYAAGAMDAAAMQEGEGTLPGGESEEASPEDSLAVIQQLVASGQLPPEVAEQLLAELQGGAGGETEEVAEETEEEKSAAAKDPVLAMVGGHRKSASATQLATAELIRAALV